MEQRTPRVDSPKSSNRAAPEVTVELPLTESRDPQMVALFETARRTADTDATVLIDGEQGVGKETLARLIHSWSPRSRNPFVAVDCANPPKQALLEELFGYGPASSGVVAAEPANVESADGGTVFLDEISDLSAPLQACLVRFVQEQPFEPVGLDRTARVKLRIIAASSRNLETEVAAGRFRSDLYYRLNVIALHFPPLRERPADILPLANWMLKQARVKAGHPRLMLSRQAAGILGTYAWPGNVRELRNVIERAVALTSGESIVPDDLPEYLCERVTKIFSNPIQGTGLRELERQYILRVLTESPSLEHAAATLGINVTTLWRKRKRYGI